MKKTSLIKSLSILSVILFLSFGCKKKFEEGNNFSFRATDNRLSKGVWDVKSVAFNNEDGSSEIYTSISAENVKEEWIFTEGTQNGTLEIRNSEGSFFLNYIVMGAKNNELWFTGEDLGDETLKSTIIKLKKKEIKLEMYYDSEPNNTIEVSLTK